MNPSRGPRPRRKCGAGSRGSTRSWLAPSPRSGSSRSRSRRRAESRSTERSSSNLASDVGNARVDIIVDALRLVLEGLLDRVASLSGGTGVDFLPLVAGAAAAGTVAEDLLAPDRVG